MVDYDYESAFRAKLKEEQIKLKTRFNILVCGYTGSGKSSLIQSILGEDVVVDEKIGHGSPKTMGYDEYRNESLTIWDSRGLEPGKLEDDFINETRQFVRSKQSNPDINEHIHVVWYTIHAPGARVTECDKRLVNEIFDPKNTIIAITKKDWSNQDILNAMHQEITESGFPASRIIETSNMNGGGEGLYELMDLTAQILPEARSDAFIQKQIVDKEVKKVQIRQRTGKAKAIIASATAAAVAAGAVPIPIADATVLVPVQIGMVAGLAALYGLDKDAVKHAVLPFIAKVAGTYVASSLSKLIPVAGSIISGSVAGTLTGAIGMYVKNSFEKIAIKKIDGITISEIPFDTNTFKEFYKEFKKPEDDRVLE